MGNCLIFPPNYSGKNLISFYCDDVSLQLIMRLNILTRQRPTVLFVYLRRYVVAISSHFACEFFSLHFFTWRQNFNCDNNVLATACRRKKTCYCDNMLSLLRRHAVAINNSDDIIDLKNDLLFATICCRNKLIFAITNVIANNVVVNNDYYSSAL